MYQDIIIAGFGGQGVLLAGRVLAYAGMIEGMHVTWFPSYGIEMRGGTSNCTVVISSEEVASPIVKNPSAIIVLNKASLIKFGPLLKSGGLAVINSSLVKEPFERSDVKAVYVPANEIAEELGDSRVVNMIALGTFVKSTGIIKMENLLNALKDILPAKRQSLLELNYEAIKRGASVVEKEETVLKT